MIARPLFDRGTSRDFASGIDLRALGYSTTEHVPSERATHVVLTR